MAKRLSPSDTMFLYGESREQMMHVAGMMPFTPAPDSPPDYLRELMNELRAGATVHAPWNLKLRTPDLLWNPLQSWIEEPAVDLGVATGAAPRQARRRALPAPDRRHPLRAVRVARPAGGVLEPQAVSRDVRRLAGGRDGVPRPARDAHRAALMTERGRCYFFFE